MPLTVYGKPIHITFQWFDWRLLLGECGCRGVPCFSDVKSLTCAHNTLFGSCLLFGTSPKTLPPRMALPGAIAEDRTTLGFIEIFQVHLYKMLPYTGYNLSSFELACSLAQVCYNCFIINYFPVIPRLATCPYQLTKRTITMHFLKVIEKIVFSGSWIILRNYKLQNSSIE